VEENPDGPNAPRDVTPPDGNADARIRRVSRRAFLQAGVVSASALGGLWAFNKYAPGDENDNKDIFKKTHAFNEATARRVFFSPTHRSREFARSEAVEPPNNYKGETPTLDDLGAWRLAVAGLATGGGSKTLKLADLQKLPHVSQTTELKCVEGWSRVVNWTGCRFVDFARAYAPPPGTEFVRMLSEPEGWDDEWYYVGLDMASCLHPQTLLAWAMNDKPLTAAHGAPLRLVMPHKYGIKNIKLITSIAYEAKRPADYWADRGYDWYAGL